MNNLRIVIICLFVIGTGVSSSLAETSNQIWAELLQQHVHDGIVDYIGFKRDEKKLDTYLTILDETKPASLGETERLALYINAYNAYTIKLILKNFKNDQPVSSIRDIGNFFKGPWDIKFCRIGGKVYTLDNIEHDIIRPEFREPRVHFAINCASKSCPPLLSEPYTSENLDAQLTGNTVAFLNDSRFNFLEGDTLNVSKIFKWFSKDFNNDIVSFFRKYAKKELRDRMNVLGDSIKINYLQYDWSLNNGK